MSEFIELLIHFFVSAIKLLKPGGMKVVMEESLAIKQQLIVMNRGKKRSPVLTTPDRFLFGILAVFISGNRLKKIAVIIKPTTLLAFHKSLPKYLSSDNDPLFLFHRWQCNLRVLDVEELKSVPGTPTSHPFIERVIGATRREYLDHMLFFNERDLQNKLDRFQAYYNDVRAHSSLGMKTPATMAFGEEPDEKVVSINRYQWKKHCNGLYELPMAA